VSTNGTTPQQLESDIERQREELAATVSQLQAKIDVKTRAQHKAAELKADIKDRATTATGKPRPDLAAAGVAALALVVGLVVWRRRH
jgi:MYXO-CTERM domain-containing protein